MQETLAQTTDSVARYIYTSQHFNNSGAKHSAFIDTRNPSELSVCVITDLPEVDIWKIGTEIRPDRPVKARADLSVSNILNTSNGQGGFLTVMIDGRPHPRHANIKNLPLEKSQQRVVATELANKSTLVLAQG
jgi:hypothetical protein